MNNIEYDYIIKNLEDVCNKHAYYFYEYNGDIGLNEELSNDIIICTKNYRENYLGNKGKRIIITTFLGSEIEFNKNLTNWLFCINK